jgi:hypothetical protein
VACLSDAQWLAKPFDEKVNDAIEAIGFLETGHIKGNRFTVRNPDSDAGGKWQIIPGTWRGWVKQFGISYYPFAHQAPAAVQEQVARAAMSQILRKYPNNIHAVPLVWFRGSIGSYPSVMNESSKRPDTQASWAQTWGGYARYFANLVRCDSVKDFDLGSVTAASVAPKFKGKLPFCLGLRGDDVLVLNKLFGLPEGSPNVFGSALQFHILQFQLVNKLPTTGCYDVAVDKLISSSFVGLVGESVVVDKIVWNGAVPKASQGLRQDLKGKAAGVSHITGEGLVYIGQGNHRLTVAAAKGFWGAEDLIGSPIWVTDSYRSASVQADVAKRKPGLAVAQGKSFHERGAAVDVNTNMGDVWVGNVRNALVRNGWYTISNERWHLSFGKAG